MYIYIYTFISIHTSSSNTSPLQNGFTRHLLGQVHAFSADSNANGPESLMDHDAQQDLPCQRHAFRKDDALIVVMPERQKKLRIGHGRSNSQFLCWK